jgi:DNA-binding NarL/FixJ family response regulator
MRPEIRILIADDQAMIREALSNVLEQEPDLLVVGQACNGAEAMEKVALLRPHILLLDLIMPRMSGIEVLRRFSKYHVQVSTIILSDTISDCRIVEALRLGAHGIVPKHATPELLFKGIRAVAAGEYWIGHENMHALMKSLLAGPAAEIDGTRSRGLRLTPTEQKVVAAIASGQTNKDIARHCSISEQTVKHHLTRIFEKVGVPNRLKLALYAMKNLDESGE